MQETRVRSLGQEDPLEKEMATHSSNLAWEIPWTEEPGGLPSIGLHRVDTTEQLHFHFQKRNGFVIIKEKDFNEMIFWDMFQSAYLQFLLFLL